MPDYKVHVAKGAAREVRKLTREAQQQVATAMKKLAENPLPPGIEKLRSNPGFFRHRAGSFRIIFAIRSDAKLIIVLVVCDRKDAFKGLEKLDKKLAVALIEVAGTVLETSAVLGRA